MPLISTSQDIFFLVLAFCTLWITVCIAWLLYYIISITRQMHTTMTSLKRAYKAVGSKVSLFKDNSLVTLITSNLAGIVGSMIKNKYTKKKTKN